MVRRRSIKALEYEIEIQKAILAIKSNQYKSIYAAAKALGLQEDTLRRRVNGGNTDRSALTTTAPVKKSRNYTPKVDKRAYKKRLCT